MRLRVLYEDKDVVVMKAPHDKELEELVVEVIRDSGKPLNWRSLREEFSGIAGEDRLRRALYNLISRGELIELPGNTYALPDMVTPEQMGQLLARKKRFYWYFGRRRKRALKGVQSN